MAKRITNTAKKVLRRQRAVKRGNRKKFAFIAVIALAVIAVAVFGILSESRKNNAETYSAGGQTVYLYQDGKFTALLAHNKTKTGTYTRSTEGARTEVAFNINGAINIGSIENNRLRIPNEWDDGHGHGSVLVKTD